MKLHLHLADSGLSLSDLSLRVYEGDSPVSLSSLSLSPVSLLGTDYVLDGIPSLETVGGLTVTFESPEGVFHAYRFGVADRQPLNVIIPIREVFSDPINALSIRIFKDGVETVPDDADVVQLNPDGEYSVSGWASTPINEQWSVRWIYNGLVYSHQWTGTTGNTGTFYQSIRAMQSPIPYKVDGDNRQLFSCNFIATIVAPTSHFEEEIEEILKVGPGTPPIPPDEIVYLGFKGSLPDDSASEPFNVIIPTGGYEPDESHDTKRENRGLQIITCATDYETARDRAEAVWHYLDGLRAVVVSL